MPKHSQTSAKNVTYKKTKKTNRNNDKNCRVLSEFLDVIMDVDTFAYFDVIS